MRVCRLRMVMALERVGHRLSDAMPGLEATQKTSPVIGHSATHNPDQFWVHWEEDKKGLLCLTFQGMTGQANHIRILTDGA